MASGKDMMGSATAKLNEYYRIEGWVIPKRRNAEQRKSSCPLELMWWGSTNTQLSLVLNERRLDTIETRSRNQETWGQSYLFTTTCGSSLSFSYLIHQRERLIPSLPASNDSDKAQMRLWIQKCLPKIKYHANICYTQIKPKPGNSVCSQLQFCMNTPLRSQWKKISASWL